MSWMSAICSQGWSKDEIVNQLVAEFPKFGAAQINTLIDWKGKQPPYCKLCHVRFTGPENALVHFNHDLCTSHFSRLLYVKRRYLGEIRYGCDVCCCEVNTTEVLRIHQNSPKHRKKHESREFIMDMSKLYDRLMAIIGDNGLGSSRRYKESFEPENEMQAVSNDADQVRPFGCRQSVIVVKQQGQGSVASEQGRFTGGVQGTTREGAKGMEPFYPTATLPLMEVGNRSTTGDQSRYLLAERYSNRDQRYKEQLMGDSSIGDQASITSKQALQRLNKGRTKKRNGNGQSRGNGTNDDRMNGVMRNRTGIGRENIRLIY